MPTVSLNKKEFEKLVGKKLDLDKLKDRISYLGTDLERIEGNEIIVEIFPNRPDMLSEQGLARAFSSFIGVKTGLRKYKVKKSGHKVIVDKSVTMRPYTACAIVKNIKFDDEKIKQIMQIQEKLALSHGRNRKKSAYGLYPSRGINFPMHYIAKDPKAVKFKPLGFDKEMIASKVEQIHPKGKEYRWVAEGWEKYPFFIDSKDNVMCMLPYTNSEDTGKIDENTKEVFIECTGVDLQNINIALNIFVTMLADMGGEIYSMDIVYSGKTITTPDLKPKKMKLNIKAMNKWLGLDLSEKEVKGYLERMGYDYNGDVFVPAYRADILHEVDLYEDIAIAYGYENFKEEIPNISTIGEEDKFAIFKGKIARFLVGFGLLEVNNYHLGSEGVIEVEGGSSEYGFLRNWLVPGMLKNLRDNKSYDYPQKIFEIGTIFKKGESETGVIENDRLGLLVSHGDAGFTEVKQILDSLLSYLGFDYKIEECTHDSFIEGRCGRVIVNGKNVAYIGELHPKVLEGLGMPVAGFELNLSEIF
ncbi:MAG: phenylalanine--tRNA ligase subunit beta [Nanoarchaeota archaeon]|nr:phenylalanine--tRNA ligase subunit beta [Nanoarchaeota archaeon]